MKMLKHKSRYEMGFLNTLQAHDDMLEVYSLFLTTINMKSNHAESIPNVLKNLYSNVQFKRPDRNSLLEDHWNFTGRPMCS